jgi:hypothetical protein
MLSGYRRPTSTRIGARDCSGDSCSTGARRGQAQSTCSKESVPAQQLFGDPGTTVLGGL